MNPPLIIAPSILAADAARLGEEAKRAEKAGADWLHVDIMDGHFVPNLSFGPHVVEMLSKETRLFLDVHLMIERPDLYIDAFLKAHSKLISVHVEAQHDIQVSLKKIRDAGCLCGLVINPPTPFEEVEPFLDKIDLLLCMTVNPGFGGQSFINPVLEKVKKAKAFREKKKLSFHIEVDGGVNLNNALDCVAAGANVLVAGTSLFNAKNMKKEIETMHQLQAMNLYQA